MWIVPRGLIRSGQLRGMTPEMMRQACECRFDVSDKSNGGKQSVESKKELMKRLKHSPDEMDSAILCIHLAVEKFGLVGLEKGKKNDRPGYKTITRKNLMGETIEYEVKLPEHEWARFKDGYRAKEQQYELALQITFDGHTYE